MAGLVGPMLFYVELTNAAQGDPTSNPNGTNVGYVNNTRDLYGIGIRSGIYLQILAFIVNFLNLLRLEPKSQFAGVILAIGMLVRWFARIMEHSISTSELWVALALILSFTTPGAWVLVLSFSAQRHAYANNDHGLAIARKRMVEGQGLNILQTLVVFLWVVAANSYFTYHIIIGQHGADFPAVAVPGNPMWVFKTGRPTDSWIRVFVIAQAIVTTILTAFPVMLYLWAWIGSIKEYWSASRHPETPPKYQGERLDFTCGCIEGLLAYFNFRTKRVVYVANAIVFFAYSFALALSAEMTIRKAGLTPEEDVQQPGQLLPLITGVFALLSALADWLRRPGPEELRPKPMMNLFQLRRAEHARRAGAEPSDGFMLLPRHENERR